MVGPGAANKGLFGSDGGAGEAGDGGVCVCVRGGGHLLVLLGGVGW